MSVKMRLTRMGDHKSPFYRIVVMDSRKARDGMYSDKVGHYNPLTEELVINKEKAAEWIKKGVQPSTSVKTLLIKEGILQPSGKKSAPKTKAKKSKK